MEYLIYFIIIGFSTTVGSLSGMGGGVIIKPALDALSYSDLSNINFYSSFAVFSMATISLIKKYKNGEKISIRKLIYILLGSILGGKIGYEIFQNLLVKFDDDIVKLIQIAIVILILSVSVYYTSFCKYSLNIKNEISYFIISFILGVVSTFLGIGGGPINVSLFMFVFGIEIKIATFYSILTIFFSQLSKNFVDFFIIGVSAYNIKPLFFIFPAALLGGNLGTTLNLKSSNKFVQKIYTITTIGVILLNIINGLKILINL
ncbi:sulfite exporter TauE/SafE family protein [Oceanivirga salmonicida]|uniref:sulfite exporter TauE/SafE family protein n=1 Tax=Oceanivirga salmonicida TaxID=1769291 RepID=UPI0012E21AC6|nr:sulfite exporter TauE/SafE family protein [Oceanivirga salmonicida]